MKRKPTSQNVYPQATNSHDKIISGQHKGEGEMFREENEELTNKLKDKVQSLKSMSIEIGEEIRGQKTFLDEMDNTFGKSGNLLEKTMQKLGFVSKGSQKYHMLMLFCFCFFMFLLLWLVLKFR